MRKHSNRTTATRRRKAVANSAVRDQLGVIGEDLGALGRHVRDATTEQLHHMGDRARAMGEDVGDIVKSNPLRTVLVAAGVGALVGVLFWRR